MQDKKRVFIIGTVWPEVTSSAAGLRDENLVSSFLDSKWEVFYSSPSQENQYSDLLKEKGVIVYSCPANDSGFDAYIQKINPQIVIFDRFLMEEQFSFRVREAVPDALRIVDTQDLHFLRRARLRALESNYSLEDISKCNIPLFSQDLVRECASIFRSDLTLVLSLIEIKLLEEKFNIPKELLFYLPFSYDKEKIQKNNQFSETKNFFFIGNFRHAPNWDAVKWLKKDLWPEIKKKCPDSELHIYGAYPPKDAMDMDHKESGFRVFGPLSNLFEKIKNYRVNLAPLRAGAGIKGKITDSWRGGIPTVTTGVGSEGLCFPDGRFGGMSVNGGDHFIRASIELYTQEEKWKKCRDIGIEFLETYMLKDHNTNRLMRKIEETLKHFKHARERNLFQNILWHEQFQRTKYFSKWIEEKNKKLEF